MNGSGESDNRRVPRTNLFVMATMHAGSRSVPVKVRNLSQYGALIEGSGLPESCAQVRLCRAELDVAGIVVWCAHGRAGLRFQTPVNVADWLPGGPAHAGQHRVDQLVQQVKSSGSASTTSQTDLEEAHSGDISVAELNSLRKAIETLAEDLAGDPAVVDRFGKKLQMLDIAAQTLGKIAASRG